MKDNKLITISIPQIRIVGDKVLAAQFIGPAKSQMRILENSMKFQNLSQAIRRVKFNSNVYVECVKVFNIQIITITALAEKIVKIKEEIIPEQFYIYVTCGDYCFIWNIESDDYLSLLDEDENDIIFPAIKITSKIESWLEQNEYIETQKEFAEGFNFWNAPRRIIKVGSVFPGFPSTYSCEKIVDNDWDTFVEYPDQSECFCNAWDCSKGCSGGNATCTYSVEYYHEIIDPILHISELHWNEEYIGGLSNTWDILEEIPVGRSVAYDEKFSTLIGDKWNTLNYSITKYIEGTSGFDINGSYRTENIYYSFTTPIGFEYSPVLPETIIPDKIQTYNFSDSEQKKEQSEVPVFSLFCAHKSDIAVCQIYLHHYSVLNYSGNIPGVFVEGLDRTFVIHASVELIDKPDEFDPTTFSRSVKFEKALEDLVNATYSNNYDIGGLEKTLDVSFYKKSDDEII